MKIPPSKPRRSSWWRALFDVKRVIVGTLGVVALSLTLVTGIVVGIRVEQAGLGRHAAPLTESRLTRNIIDPALRTARAVVEDGENVAGNFLEGVAASATVERLHIDVKHVDWQRIAWQRESSLRTGILQRDLVGYVPATIRRGEDEHDAEIRLKGDIYDHWKGDKWSLRVQVKGDDALFGMRRFSLQHPETRDFIGEWLALELLRQEGLLAVRYGFIDVSINGVHKGIYAIEEHFDKHLIESQQRREGPIVKFDEDLKWLEYVRLGQSIEDDYGSFSVAAVDGWAEDMGPGSAFERGVTMLEAFRRGERRPSEVFHVQRLATFVAIKDLLGSPELDWNDMRFYLDPVTSLLEPIGFDMHLGGEITRLFGHDGGIKFKNDVWVERDDSFCKMLFDDEVFFAAYATALDRISGTQWLDTAVASLTPRLREQLAILYREFPYVAPDLDALRHNQALIREMLAPPVPVHAYVEEDGEGLTLNVGSLQMFPVVVEALEVGTALVAPATPVVVPAREHAEPVRFERVRFDTAAPPDTELRVVCRVLGTERLTPVVVRPWSYLRHDVVYGDWRFRPSNLDSFGDMLDLGVEGAARIRPGKWIVDRDLIVPQGVVLEAGPGVEIDLRNGASIVASGPVRFGGKPDAPVLLHSTDATGAGIVCIAPGDVSTVRHTHFVGLAAPNGAGWALPGAVTFYEAPVQLEDVVFRDSRSEDALNIMRTEFRMTRATFDGTQSDAFDGDFVSGAVIDSVFVDTGNDAVDVSGSTLTLRRVTMLGVGDKAISAGEGSTIEADGIRVSEAEIGMASKDRSTIEARDVSFENCRLGFTAFQKKPEFGPGVIEIDGMQASAIDHMELIAHGSTLVIDGVLHRNTVDDVEGALYGVIFGRHSKTAVVEPAP